MSTFQDTFDNSTYINSTVGSEVVSGELRPLDHDDSVTLTFNGTSQYGRAVGYKGVTGSSACTIMGWFKTTETDSDNTLIYWGTGATFARRWLRLEAGVLWDRLVADTVNGGSNLGDGQWHHFAIVNPASASISQFLIYIDGISVTVATTTSGGTINIGTTDDVYVGSLPGPTNLFKGSLDDFRLYNTALTADQIFSLVHAGIEPPTTNLQAHWLFNDGSGSSVNDETANNRDLTLTGSPTWTTTHKPFYANRSLSTSTQIVTNQASITDFDFTVSKRSAGTLGRFQFSDDGSTWVNKNNDPLTYGSYFFDGVNDVISVSPDASINNIFSGGGTIMGWFYATGSGSRGILNKNQDIIIYVSGSNFNFFRDHSIIPTTWQTADPVSPGWHHFAITYDDSSNSNDPIIYIDGASHTITNPTTLGTASDDSSGNLEIGRGQSSSWYYNGYLADIRVYKGDILSATTIRDYYLYATEPSETLDAHWKFNGNALDETANNNDGSVSGALNKTDFELSPPIGNYDLTSGSVLSFDGANDEITVADNNVFSFGNGSTDSPFSISAWIYMHDASNFKIVSKDNNTTNLEWILHTNGSDQLIFLLWDDSAGSYISRFTGTITHLQNQWVHVAGTYDGSRTASGIKIYINGNQADITTFNSGSYTAMENTSQIVQIGARGSSDYANGSIANVAIWSDLRTQAEIIAEVENGYVETGNANLIAYYPLDGDADDYLGNYNGTNNGATTVTDYKRPAIVAPSQSTIDISGLSFTDLYYRYLTESNQAEFTTALTEISADYLTVQNIVIKDNLGTTIADGEATPQDFGEADQGDTAPALTFTIQNTGETTLTISSINLPSGYSISGATPSTIAGNSTDTFTVELSTATVGTFAGDIEVNSDDPDTAVYNFAVTGVINLSTPDTTLEEALLTFLAAKEDLPDIYPVRRPRADIKPAITVWRWGGGGDHSLSGATNSGTAYMQISIWSNTSKEAKDYAKTLRGYLQNYYGLMGGRFIYSIVAEDEIEMYEPPVEGQQQGTIQLICQYTIRHKEPLPSLSVPSEAITDAIVDIGLTDYIKTTLAVDMYSAGFPHESITLPGIIYRRAGNKHYHSLTGAVNKALVTFEFDCHAGTMKEAVALGESLRLILQGFRGVLDGCKINSVLYKTQKQKYIRPLVSDGGRFICTMEFDALVNE